MDGAQFLLEGALVLLLGATLFHAVRLERALGVLKRDRAVLEELVAGFNDSTRQAEAGVERLRAATDGAGRQMARQIEQSQRLKDDLVFLGERGERLAERLEGAVRSARMVGDQQGFAGLHMQAAQPPPQSPPPPPPASVLFGGLEDAEPAPAATVRVAEPAGQKLRSEAERDLLRALRAAR